MPIRPENRHRYPKDWPAISKRIRERAGNKCEECGIANGKFRNNTTGEITTNPMQVETWELADGDSVAKIVLTVAHLNHQPEDCSDDNLKALCQRCHNQYDAPMRAAGIKARRREKLAISDLFGI
jgi:5-methylcytosine-specific restriction endonuclease McrA